MANVVNDRDVLIMGTSPRYSAPTDRGMFITPSSAVFKVSADGATASPASFTFQVTLLNMTGTITFSFSNGMTPTVNGNTVTLSYANMSAVSGTITANITVDGQLYTAIANVAKVADGASGGNGIRGNVDIAAVTSGSVWSDSEAVAALAAAGYGAPQVRDMVTLYKSDRTFGSQKMYNGSAWVAVDYVLNGNVFVKGSILPEAIDTRGLTIKDAQGNVILGSGTGLPTAYAAPGTLNSDLTPSITAAANTAVWTSVSNRPSDDSIKNNLIDLSWWTRGASLPWSQNSEYNSIAKCSPVGGADLLMPGPKGSDDAVWYCKEVTGDGQQGGGWEGPYYALDKTKTYRFVVPIRKISGTSGQAYWGTHEVADLNTTNLNGNPYFAVAGLSNTDRWYLFVGYIYPANSIGNTNDSAGIWDCKTGAKVVNGTNYCFMPDGRSVMHRAYQFYASANAEQAFGRPMINLVDGTEPSLREYLEAAALLNSQQQWTDVNGRPTAYRIVAAGGSANGYNIGPGFYVENTSSATYGAGRSYNLIVIRRSDHVIVYNNSFDVYGDITKAYSLRDILNGYGSDVVVVIYTADEPQNNRLESTLAAAIYRCGASKAVYGSPQFQYRSAYILVGIPGVGEGGGAEAYQGSVGNDPNAWCDIGLTIDRLGNYQVSANYTPRSLSDYGYTGDYNANYTTNTNQLTDGAGLGTTALWSNIAGQANAPASNATVGATIGTNLFGQMNASNISTYIAAAAINLALINKASIGSLSALSAVIGTLRTATSGARTEISDNVIKVFDTSNQLRVRLGDLSL
jgi:hypothetical protein